MLKFTVSYKIHKQHNMLDKLVELAKGQLLPSLIDDPDVDNAQAEEIARVSGDSVINSLMEQAKGGDLSGLQEMRSEEHTSELQSLMRISYAVFCLQKKN